MTAFIASPELKDKEGYDSLDAHAVHSCAPMEGAAGTGI
jgi:hypothetical protein